MDLQHRRAAVAVAAERIAELNAERSDDFQDTAMGEIRRAQGAFRAWAAGELPPAGDDALLDALAALARALDSSPETVSGACAAALKAAGIPVAKA